MWILFGKIQEPSKTFVFNQFSNSNSKVPKTDKTSAAPTLTDENNSQIQTSITLLILIEKMSVTTHWKDLNISLQLLLLPNVQISTLESRKHQCYTAVSWSAILQSRSSYSSLNSENNLMAKGEDSIQLISRSLDQVTTSFNSPWIPLVPAGAFSPICLKYQTQQHPIVRKDGENELWWRGTKWMRQ